MCKPILCGLTLVAVLAVATLPARGAFPEEARQALRLCAADAQAALASAPLSKELPIAILPVRGDAEGYVIGLLKNAVIGAGLLCVEGKEDPAWEELVKEIEFNERKSDLLDPATLTRFGQLKSAKVLLSAIVRETSAARGRGYAEIEVHASTIETKQHLWGQTFARRFYQAQDVAGLVSLDPEVRQALKEAFERAAAGLKADAKLKDIRTIAIIPLAGDMDRFVTGLAESMVTKTQFFPKQLDTATLGEARALLRDQPQAADAILYGAVRDLSQRILNHYPDRIEYEINAAAQLTIQDAKTGNILWSDLIEARRQTTQQFTGWEMLLRYGPLVLARKWYFVSLAVIVLGLAALALFYRALRRAR